MTVEGNAKTYTGITVTNVPINMETDFLVNLNGIRQNDHAGFWLINMDTTAANIIWYRLDATVATVEGDDCYPLRPGERVYVRKTSNINFIAAAGTPKLVVGGDQSGMVYS